MNIQLFIACIALIETGGDDSKIGKAGERSQYQISEAVWVDASLGLTPFTLCRGEAATAVAKSHAAYLAGQRRNTAEKERVLWTAYAWNRGLARAKGTKAKVIAADDYANRVWNLYEWEMKKRASRGW